MIKERPILFSTENVKAILDGIKTQSRRVVTPQTSVVGQGKVNWSKFCWDGSQIYRDTWIHGQTEEHQAPLPFVDGRANKYYPYEHQYLHVPYNWTQDMTIFRVYPKWEVGDKLWVKETCFIPADFDHSTVYYKADWGNDRPAEMYNHNGKWRPSIFMPRWASRILLEITEVRVERLQEITETDAIAEGVDTDSIAPPQMQFCLLWDSLNAKRGYSWNTNPFVWVISFKKANLEVY